VTPFTSSLVRTVDASITHGSVTMIMTVGIGVMNATAVMLPPPLHPQPQPSTAPGSLSIVAIPLSVFLSIKSVILFVTVLMDRMRMTVVTPPHLHHVAGANGSVVQVGASPMTSAAMAVRIVLIIVTSKTVPQRQPVQKAASTA
jgi:hypothetical protein